MNARLKWTSGSGIIVERKWKGREKIQKFEYLDNEKSFFNEKKTFLIVFEGLSFGIKKIGKKSGHKL